MPSREGQGGQRRQFHQILALRKRGHQVDVLVPRSSQSDASLREIAQVRRPLITVRGRVLRNRMRRAHAYMGSPDWDAIVVSHVESWWLLPDLDRLSAPVLLDVHNVLSHWHREAGRHQDADRAIEMERDALKGAAAVTTCSQTETARLKAMHPHEAKKIFTAPLGIDPGEWPAVGFSRDEPIVAMFGTWSWRPNALGLRWFLEEVWPNVTAQIPEARALVAGSGAADHSRWPAGAKFVGRVDDLADFTSSATVIAVPVLEGVGASVKFAEALATGAAVIATPDGANAVPNPPAHITSVAEDWAAWISDRLRRRHEEPVPARSRQIALDHLSWDAATTPISEWLADLGDHHSPQMQAVRSGSTITPGEHSS
jgi:glycosyltransferase involved in cell wall biosynthesis